MLNSFSEKKINQTKSLRSCSGCSGCWLRWLDIVDGLVNFLGPLSVLLLVILLNTYTLVKFILFYLHPVEVALFGLSHLE